MADPLRVYRMPDNEYDFVRSVFKIHKIKKGTFIRSALNQKAVELDLTNRMKSKLKEDAKKV
jgi:hypothetical protein